MKTKRSQHLSLLLVTLIFGLASCKAPKTIIKERVRPISTNKLIKNIKENAFEYNWLSIKRIACQYETPDHKTSFRANLKSEKDKRILLTFNKLNVPVGRLFLTPDSVKLINYLEKNYLFKDYDYLSNLVNADLDFDVVQSVLSNTPFSYRDDPRNNDYREFVSYINSGMYVLQSLKNRKLTKIERKGKQDKIGRYLRKMDEDDFVVQYLYVDPKTFKIREIILDDKSNKRKVNIEFSDFVEVEEQLYPGNINIHFESPSNTLKMKIKLSKFSLGEELNFNFKIPEKYTQVH